MGDLDDRQAVPGYVPGVLVLSNLAIGWAALFGFTIGLSLVVTVLKPNTEPVTQIFTGVLLLAEIVLGV
ncbi:hypothetical protein [Frondihabitans peucedani]|uniref:Integral membrane protein n=1 Tax=Frondihabitans peucedani TaxID=598626 RepID=A0ABP8E6W3_9MICO